jgi:hypothetical protein
MSLDVAINQIVINTGIPDWDTFSRTFGFRSVRLNESVDHSPAFSVKERTRQISATLLGLKSRTAVSLLRDFPVEEQPVGFRVMPHHTLPLDSVFGTPKSGFRLSSLEPLPNLIRREAHSGLQAMKPYFIETKSFREFHKLPKVAGPDPLDLDRRHLPWNNLPVGGMVSRVSESSFQGILGKGFGERSFIRYFDSRRIRFGPPSDVLWDVQRYNAAEDYRKMKARRATSSAVPSVPDGSNETRAGKPRSILKPQKVEDPNRISLTLLRGSALRLYASARKRGYAGGPNRWLKVSRTARSLPGWYKGISCNRMNSLLRWIDIGPVSPYPEVPERFKSDSFKTPVILAVKVPAGYGETPYPRSTLKIGQRIFVRPGVRFGAIRFLFARGTDLSFLRSLSRVDDPKRLFPIRKHVRFELTG